MFCKKRQNRLSTRAKSQILRAAFRKSRKISKNSQKFQKLDCSDGHKLAIFDGIFFISFERYCFLELKFEKKNISHVIIFRKVMGFKDAILANLGQLTRNIFRANNALTEI